jgi:hypothetical protein
MTTYERLKRAGHSPSKAAEIALDIKRGDPWAAKWFPIAAKGRKP